MLVVFLQDFTHQVILTINCSSRCRSLSSDIEEGKEIYHKVKTHLGKNGIEDFYIKYQELHIPKEIVSINSYYFKSILPCCEVNCYFTSITNHIVCMA